MTEYKIPKSLSAFQKKLFTHLINWKWQHISKETGYYIYKGKPIEHDAILPYKLRSELPHLYPSIKEQFRKHNRAHKIKLHRHFYHMVSSQAAAVNLFLPLLCSANAEEVLSKLKPDLKTIDRDQLFNGFRFEYWDGTGNNRTGLLGDHNARSGTDADIAIAYRNHDNELCLWLIEHKLKEDDFTNCGGYKTRRKHGSIELCAKSFKDILRNHETCYYNSVRHTRYWELTRSYKELFSPCQKFITCPFNGGVNQLWRNQLLGLAVVSDPQSQFKHSHLSVVKHPMNTVLDKTINQYRPMIGDQSQFSVLDSSKIIAQARVTEDKELVTWADWYYKLYLDL